MSPGRPPLHAPTDGNGPSFDEPFLQARRLREMGRLVPGLIHELNNPLCAMRSNLTALATDIGLLTDLMTDVADPPETQKSFAREALADLRLIGEENRGCVDRIVELVGDVGWYAGPGPSTAPRASDLPRALGRALRLCRSEIRYRADVEVEMPPLPAAAIGERDAVQILLNLLLNASDAFRASPAETGGNIRVRAARDGRTIRLEVQDDGPGIDPGDVPAVFDPGFTSRVGPGSEGLGLTLSRHLAARSGGSLSIVPSPGPGARITLVLPDADP